MKITQNSTQVNSKVKKSSSEKIKPDFSYIAGLIPKTIKSLINNIADKYKKPNSRNRKYPLEKMLFSSAFQMMDPSGSYSKETVRNSIATASKDCVEVGYCKLKDKSLNTGAYTRALQKVPIEAYTEAVTATYTNLEANYLTKNFDSLNCYIVDGSTFTVDDTLTNREYFKKHGNLQEGEGYPLGRALAISSAQTRAILAMEIAPYSGKGTGELSLLKKIIDKVPENSILIADAYYSSYTALALCNSNNIDIITEKKGKNKFNFSKGDIIRKDEENIYQMFKPRYKRNSSFSKEEYEKLPDSIVVRQIKLTIETVNGIYSLIILTTLHDTKKHSTEQICKLSQERWPIETTFGELKTTSGNIHIAAKSPDMVIRKIQAIALGYNLIRATMLEISQTESVPLSNLSFQNTLFFLLMSTSFYSFIQPYEKSFKSLMFKIIPTIIVGKRPLRFEPRVVKKRPSKGFPTLKGSRSDVKKKMRQSKMSFVI